MKIEQYKKFKKLDDTEFRIAFAENAIKRSKLIIQKEEKSIEKFKKELIELLIQKEIRKKLGKILL